MNFSKLLVKTICFSVVVLIPAFALAEESSKKQSDSNEIYMIGVSSYPVSSSLRSHLSIIPEGLGLQIRNVVDDGIASKVLKMHDILLEANERPLKSITDLYEVVQKAGLGGQSIEMSVIREGKPILLIVPTPKKTDRQHRSLFSGMHHRKGPRFGPPKHHGHHKKHDSFDMSKIPSHFLDMRFPKKLSTLRSSFRTEDDYFVVVEQMGEKMSILVVSKDGKRWHVKKDELDSLPESVQAEIQLRLKDLPAHNEQSPTKNSEIENNRIAKLEKQLGEMSEQLKSLTKLIESMNKNLPQSK